VIKFSKRGLSDQSTLSEFAKTNEVATFYYGFKEPKGNPRLLLQYHYKVIEAYMDPVGYHVRL
ncbi:hypothetical protein B9J76_09025, partial [Lacticaseibacillus paracasei]